MTDVNEQLRALLIGARKDPERWGKPRGLSQAQLADKADVSAIWLRQIETGQAESASADLLGRIFYELEIDSIIVGAIGYPDVAAAIDACVMIRENAIPDHVIDNPRKMRKKSPEEHLKGTPGITAREKKLLIEAFYLIRKQPA